jgi:drug/metabolite transporter (DMT)-like permease
MTMSGTVVLLVLLAALLHAVWNALLRGGRDRFWSSAVMSLAAGVTCLSVISFLPLPKPQAWFFIVASAVVHLFYNLLLVRMYRQGDFGHTYPVARGSSPLLITLGGVLFASEHLSPHVFLGICLVSAGIVSLAFGAKAHTGTFLAAFSTGCSIAIYSVIDGLGARASGNAAAYTAWMVMGYGFVMPIVFSLSRSPGKPKFWQGSALEFAKAGAGGVASILAYGIVVWAMAHGPLGPVSALRETSVLFAVLIGCFFLKEKFTTQKTVAVILIVLGSFTLHFS